MINSETVFGAQACTVQFVKKGILWQTVHDSVTKMQPRQEPNNVTIKSCNITSLTIVTSDDAGDLLYGELKQPALVLCPRRDQHQCAINGRDGQLVATRRS